MRAPFCNGRSEACGDDRCGICYPHAEPAPEPTPTEMARAIEPRLTEIADRLIGSLHGGCHARASIMTALRDAATADRDQSRQRAADERARHAADLHAIAEALGVSPGESIVDAAKRMRALADAAERWHDNPHDDEIEGALVIAVERALPKYR